MKTNKLLFFTIFVVFLIGFTSAFTYNYLDTPENIYQNISVQNDTYQNITVNQNLFDQSLNTTDDVVFNQLNLSCVGWQYDNASCLNVSGDAYFRDIHARDGYFAASTLYIGDQISLSSGGVGGDILNISGGNVSAEVYFGSGQYLTDLNLINISFAGDTINATTFNGQLFNGGLFNGEFNWTATLPWLNFDGFTLLFNETYLNQTITNLFGNLTYTLNQTIISNNESITNTISSLNQTLREDAEITVNYLSTILVSSGGNITGSSSSFDFVINEISVVPNNASTQYQFEASEFTTGNIVDRNRITHTGTWRIEKNYPIDDALNFSITSVNIDDTFNITIKYLNNFD